VRGAGRAVKCAACVYWKQPAGGLDPQRRRDQPAGWWRDAGHCLRFAPRPTTEPGAHGFWSVTSAGDACGDGKAGAPAHTGA
jgi:hypothetical protein